MGVRLVLHPEQVREALDLAAELDLDPQTVLEGLFGTDTLLTLPTGTDEGQGSGPRTSKGRSRSSTAAPSLAAPGPRAR